MDDFGEATCDYLSEMKMLQVNYKIEFSSFLWSQSSNSQQKCTFVERKFLFANDIMYEFCIFSY